MLPSNRSNPFLKIGLLSSLFVLLQACGGKSDTENNAIPEDKDGKSLLWEISGNGLSKPSYLFGTIHIIPKDDFFTGPNIEKAVAASEVLVMEVANINDLGASLNLMKDMKLDSGTIVDLIDSTRFQKLIDYVHSELGIDSLTFMQTYGSFKPFGLYTLSMQLQDLKMKDTKSYEKYLMELAFHEDIPTDGLETLEFQMSVFNSMSYEDVVDGMLQGGGEENMGKMFTELVDHYKTQDLEAMFTYTTQSDDIVMNKYKKIFLDDRNADWIPKIEKMISDKVCFIAVGAAHLGGEKGVLKLLREKGYTLRPLAIE